MGINLVIKDKQHTIHQGRVPWKVGHVQLIEGESKGEQLGTKTFMLQKAEQIMRQHYEVKTNGKF